MPRFTALRRSLALIALLPLGACSVGDSSDNAAPADSIGGGRLAGVVGRGDGRATDDDIARARGDTTWRRVVQFEGTRTARDTTNRERWDSLSIAAVNGRPMRLPVGPDDEGASVLRTQILLDRALFSPGIMDGRWGQNTEKAVYWFQRKHGLPATGEVDQATFDRLVEAANEPGSLVRAHRLTTDDVEGPFVEIPEDIYARAELDCLCYESLPEKLAERFHTSADLLRQLNPGSDLATVAAGDELNVPTSRGDDVRIAVDVATIRISDGGQFLHALDANGTILFHAPSTLGSSYSPSPSGDYQITSITEEPWWHYQPALLEGVDDGPDAQIPPGPNNSVGLVWMALSEPHYGIHGTSAPETIGYVTSSGCVRLTNWDALFLARRISDGVRVEFVDTV